MNNEIYKFVPVEPTQDMIEWVQAACVEHLSAREAYDIAKTLIIHAPEPVCRHFPSDDEIREFLGVECQAGLIADIDDELLPLAREIIAKFGKIVEVVGDE